MAQRYANGALLTNNKNIFEVMKADKNVSIRLREPFNVYDKVNTWNEVAKDSTDIVQMDGNALDTGYLVISKDPLTTNTVTIIETYASFSTPLEAVLGFSMSQRTIGQEFSWEIISTETPMTAQPDVAITSISQSGTTYYTVICSAPHGLKAGNSVCIYGNSNSSFNSPAAIVSSASTLNFTVSTTPNGAIPVITASGTGGFVSMRSRLSSAPNGVSHIFENTALTTAAVYVRSDGNPQELPSGTTPNGAHGITVATTASFLPAAITGTYIFQPTSEYRLTLNEEFVSLVDVAVDSVSQPSSRFRRTQVIPNPNVPYKVRFRFNNSKSLTVPVAKIISATKTGTTTTTIVTDVPHGLTISDQVQLFGIRDQTNFANLTSSVTPASIVDAYTFTIAMGIAATATSYGGAVIRAQGGFGLAGFVTNGNAGSIQRVSNLVTLNTISTMSGVQIGDYVNLYGIRDQVTGADIGLDGVYRVRDFPTTTQLILEPIGNNPNTGADVTLINCGGIIIRRTDARISYFRVLNYDRQRVEFRTLGSGDLSAGINVSMLNTPNIGTVTSLSNLPVNRNNDIVSAAITTSATVNSTTTSQVQGGGVQFNVAVTAVSGTNPTFDLGLEESMDGGTNWVRRYDFPRITANGSYNSPVLPQSSTNIWRYVQTIGGTTPSFTRSISRAGQGAISVPITRQFITKTLADTTTLNAATSIFEIEGTSTITAYVNLSVYTSAATLGLDTSVDGTNWVNVSTAAISASGITRFAPVFEIARFVRVRVVSTGATNTIDSITIKAVA